MTITTFPGSVGGTLANVNRWRSQLGLEPVEASDLPKMTSSLDVLGGKAMLVDMTGSDKKTSQKARLIAAMVAQKAARWFYKLMGDEQVVARERNIYKVCSDRKISKWLIESSVSLRRCASRSCASAWLLLLVFIGTLAQVDQGLLRRAKPVFSQPADLLVAQRSGLEDSRFAWRVFAGWYSVGKSHCRAHQTLHFQQKKIGIFLIHAGLILLLLGQFATDLLQVETHMRLSGGEAKNYSESDRLSELVLIDSASADQ